ncbi:MAG: signal recognition particle-docking protein FtsY [Deltaproteobacteria bacterium]|nr:signal recognition particle-docking protein FtsY [Deltaproteobacteria bacterium]
MSVFQKLKSGLARTHDSLMGRIEGLFSSSATREELLSSLEEALILADVGVKTSAELVDGIRDRFRGKGVEEIRDYLKESIFNILKDCQRPLEVSTTPFVIMALGVNGVGKTTTIGKMAARFKAEGKKVILGAGDTFRAAAIEQLEAWGKRVDCDVIKQAQGGDPGAVAFDATRAAIARKVDVLIIDTAGRLHTKTNLMEELKKVKRVISRELPGAPHEVLLVLDATTGQNALTQARVFNEALSVTGIALAKLDGTAKGGIIVAIADELKIPIRYIGIGEDVEDLRAFDAREFVEAMI